MGHSSRGRGAALLGLLAVIQVVSTSAQTLSTGSLSVSWDVVKSSIKEYTVVVRLRNNQLINPVPAPGWALSWTWQQNEMVETVEGAQVLNLADCSGTSAADDFPDKVWYAVTCAARPIFVSTVNQGYLPAASVDNVNNTAQFTIVLGKGSDYWGVGNLTLPSNFDIGLPGYQCTLPAPVAAGRSVPVSIGGRQYYTAIRSYDFTCSLSPQFVAKPTCCVSFSGFFNNTVATCPACACGCNATLGSNASACASRQSGPNAATQLLFGPAVPTSSLQQISSRQTLDAAPRPCSSGCMTDIHFAVSQEFGGGWQVQVAIANTRATPIADWLLAMDLPLANYLEAVYTVQHDAARQLPNFAIFSGQPYYNDVISSAPGNVQWIMNFNKTAVAPAMGPKIRVIDQNAFPTAVYFMGQQCALPPFDAIPSNVLGQTSGAVVGRRTSAAVLVAALVALSAVLL